MNDLDLDHLTFKTRICIMYLYLRNHLHIITIYLQLNHPAKHAFFKPNVLKH